MSFLNSWNYNTQLCFPGKGCVDVDKKSKQKDSILNRLYTNEDTKSLVKQFLDAPPNCQFLTDNGKKCINSTMVYKNKETNDIVNCGKFCTNLLKKETEDFDYELHLKLNNGKIVEFRSSPYFPFSDDEEFYSSTNRLFSFTFFPKPEFEKEISPLLERLIVHSPEYRYKWFCENSTWKIVKVVKIPRVDPSIKQTEFGPFLYRDPSIKEEEVLPFFYNKTLNNVSFDISFDAEGRRRFSIHLSFATRMEKLFKYSVN